MKTGKLSRIGLENCGGGGVLLLRIVSFNASSTYRVISFHHEVFKVFGHCGTSCFVTGDALVCVVSLILCNELNELGGQQQIQQIYYRTKKSAGYLYLSRLMDDELVVLDRLIDE